jgi:hypothetical protein
VTFASFGSPYSMNSGSPASTAADSSSKSLLA